MLDWTLRNLHDRDGR